MTAGKRLLVGLSVGSLIALAAVLAQVVGAEASDRSNRIVMRDDCDPSDPDWAPIGGCTLRGGDVTTEEFDGELTSPLSESVVGHQAWRNDPSYLKIGTGESITVLNKGGRPHSFTEVAEFGGGFIPPLNVGLVPAPECADAVVQLPGQAVHITGLEAGLHRFQCCLHPWMRAHVKVKNFHDA